VWLASRSRRLRVRLHASAAAAVSSLYFAQQKDGWWPAAIAGEGGEHPPSVQATAMAVIGGRRVSSDEGHICQAEQGVAWLIGEQQPDGWWRGLRGDPDVVATALALEAVAGARRPNAESVSERAATWLLNQQLPHGTWTGDLPTVLATVVVLSALHFAASASQQVPADLAGALALLHRADLLATENSSDARQLAVVAAYTALEGVLYALLGHPTINATTVRANGQVIGFDEAWQKYEAALVESGLTIIRDGVVHRGIQPSADDTARIVEAAVRFASEQVPEIFGFDPSQD
jgi:hypothetical protein